MHGVNSMELIQLEKQLLELRGRLSELEVKVTYKTNNQIFDLALTQEKRIEEGRRKAAIIQSMSAQLTFPEVATPIRLQEKVV